MTAGMVAMAVIATWVLVAGTLLGYRGHPPLWDWPEGVKNDQERFEIVLCLFWPIAAMFAVVWLAMLAVGFVAYLPGKLVRRAVDWCRNWRKRCTERAHKNFLEWDQKED